MIFTQEIIKVNNIDKEIRVCDVNDKKYYCIADIGKILQNGNIRAATQNIPILEKTRIKMQTNGGLQTFTFTTLNGIKYYLSKCRNKHVEEVSKHFNIDVYNMHIISSEIGTLKNIMTAFDGENMQLQYRVGKYRIDLYFVDYKIAIECDERHHNQQQKYDKEREGFIEKELDCCFVRYNPQLPSFNIYSVINTIFILIKKQVL